jgi:hypothetical protein
MAPIAKAIADNSNTRRSVLKSASSSSLAATDPAARPFAAGGMIDSVCIKKAR